MPLFKLSELLLTEIRSAGRLKLTAKGNLPVRLCEFLYGQELIKWKYMKLTRMREEEIPYLWPLKHYILDQRIVKKRNNTLSLTKAGEDFLHGPKTARFTRLFLFFGTRFHWGNFYRIPDNGQCGQLGWAYSLVLLSKYGAKARQSEFYSHKLLQAFEKELWDRYQTNNREKDIAGYDRAYSIRFFENFANWFGLAKIERKRDPILFFDKLSVTKSSRFDQLFYLETHAPSGSLS